MLVITVISFLAGMGTRALAEQHLTSAVDVWPPYVTLQLVQNSGIAFSVQLGVLQPLIMCFALLLFAWMALRMSHVAWAQWGFGLILGGALANIVDRFDNATVTDYIRVVSFPVFNLPDTFITIGVLLLLAYEFVFKKREY